MKQKERSQKIRVGQEYERTNGKTIQAKAVEIRYLKIYANEIASILHKYIKSVGRRGDINNLLLYCDCWSGQYRNKVVLAMLHSTLQQCENLETIQINYLFTGHTYMPVDSVHAVIKNNLKRKIIYAPSQWYTVFTTARNDPSPYEVERLTYENFYRWDSVADKYFKGNLQ